MFRREGPTFLELARQALTSTRRGYDLLAPKFELTPFRTPEPIVEAIAKRVGSVDSALDVCCGTGAAMFHLRACCRERVVGIDFSEGMLEVARARMEQAPGTARVELVQGDVLEMPFHEEMDAAVSVGAFGHIRVEDDPRFVAGIHRALRPGGRFVFATGELPPWSSPSRWAAEGFNAAMRARNAVLSPPFIMYYLTFLWPEVRGRLIDAGFSRVEAERGAFPPPYERVLMVIASK